MDPFAGSFICSGKFTRFRTSVRPTFLHWQQNLTPFALPFSPFLSFPSLSTISCFVSFFFFLHVFLSFTILLFIAAVMARAILEPRLLYSWVIKFYGNRVGQVVLLFRINISIGREPVCSSRDAETMPGCLVCCFKKEEMLGKLRKKLRDDGTGETGNITWYTLLRTRQKIHTTLIY